MALRLLAVAMICVGLLFHLYFFVAAQKALPFAFLLYFCLPYLFATLLLWLAPSSWQSLGAAVASLLADLIIYGEAYLWPHGSTAALGVLALPLWQLFLVAPFGALVGHIIHGLRPTPIPHDNHA